MNKPRRELDDCLNGGPACPADLHCYCKQKLDARDGIPELPSKMPQRPVPITVSVPRAFPVYGTLVYAGCSITALSCFFAIGIVHWTPPWYIIMPAFLYCFVSSGIITMGRIESNKNARAFANALKQQSEENKRRMN